MPFDNPFLAQQGAAFTRQGVQVSRAAGVLAVEIEPVWLVLFQELLEGLEEEPHVFTGPATGIGKELGLEIGIDIARPALERHPFEKIERAGVNHQAHTKFMKGVAESSKLPGSLARDKGDRKSVV